MSPEIEGKSNHHFFVCGIGWNQPSEMNEESFCAFSFRSERHFASSVLDKKREKDRQTEKDIVRQAERKWLCCSDRITVCSQLLFDRTHHHSHCWDESPILRGVLEQKSLQTTQETQGGSLDSRGPPRWLWGGVNNFNLASFWLPSHQKRSPFQNFNSIDHRHKCDSDRKSNRKAPDPTWTPTIVFTRLIQSNFW